jgi:phosphohistidine phosphatase
VKYAILLRHATAQEAAADALRDLTSEGRAEAERAGRALAALGAPWRPTLALCSTALRATATLEIARSALPGLRRVDFAARLYLASAGELLATLAAVPEEDACVVVVGHEPGLSGCVRLLAQRAAPDARAAFARGMLPAAFAALQLEVALWRDAVPGCATLAAFARP